MSEQFNKMLETPAYATAESDLDSFAISSTDFAEVVWNAALASQPQRHATKAAGPEDQAIYQAIADNYKQSAEPVAWMHNGPTRVDVIHEKVKAVLQASDAYVHRPLDTVEHYTIPLYTSPPSTSAAEQAAALAMREKAAGEILVSHSLSDEQKEYWAVRIRNLPVETDALDKMLMAAVKAGESSRLADRFRTDEELEGIVNRILTEQGVK
jgi:hypothetical protein